jgi:hypothetical protein
MITALAGGVGDVVGDEGVDEEPYPPDPQLAQATATAATARNLTEFNDIGSFLDSRSAVRQQRCRAKIRAKRTINPRRPYGARK